MNEKIEPSSKPLDRTEERTLISASLRGDQASMRKLIDYHKDRLFSFIWKIVRNHHDAEEICQEAFIKAFKSLATFKPAFRFSTWLFTIAYRLCLNGMRRKQAVNGELEFSLIPSGEANVEDGFAATEDATYIREAVHSAMEHLTPVQRAAIVLFYREEHSCHEISDVLGLPVATVKSHLHRARAKLRMVLEADAAVNPEKARILSGMAG